MGLSILNKQEEDRRDFMMAHHPIIYNCSLFNRQDVINKIDANHFDSKCKTPPPPRASDEEQKKKKQLTPWSDAVSRRAGPHSAAARMVRGGARLHLFLV